MSDLSKTDILLQQLRVEFVESCGDSLDEIDGVITRLIDGGSWDNDFSELLRKVHSIKGSGGTFGFPAITLIAHSLEDYIETAAEIGRAQLDAVQIFIDAIRDIIGQGEKPGDFETTALLRRLPTSGQSQATEQTIGVDQTVRDIGFLLIMPKGLQRRIIGAEMASCGFRVNLAENAVQAIELARVFRANDATSKTKFLLMTSSDANDAKTLGLPLGARIVRKGDNFSMNLSKHLMDWGVFGDIKTRPTFTDVAKSS